MTDINELYINLKNAAQKHHVKLFGIADLEEYKEYSKIISPQISPNMKRGIVMAIPLQSAILDGIKHGPTSLYFHNYKQVNTQLDEVAFVISDILMDNGYESIAIPASKFANHKTLEGHISHKLLGYLAGLGWPGRNHLLVSEKYGSQIRFVSVLTNALLPIDKKLENDCGDCNSCVGECPAKAIKESYFDWDFEACYKKIKRFAGRPLIGQLICGHCLKACKGKK